MKVIFACVHNAGRSQMAAAFFNSLIGHKTIQATSAGTMPNKYVHPEVIDVMKEVGLDLSATQPQLLTEELVQSANLLVTMGCNEACPYAPGLTRLNWSIEDPKGMPLEKARQIRDEIKSKVENLIKQLQISKNNI